jgi:PAS domain S-box-containing protein
MAIGPELGAGRALDATRWLTRLASVAASELPGALDEIAGRIHELFPVDLVSVRLVDETGHDGTAHGHCVGPSPAAQALASLLSAEGIDPVGLCDAALATGAPVIWPRVVAEEAELERLAEVAEAGGPAGALHRLLLEASGVAVPIGTPTQPALGAVALVSLSSEAPIPESAIEELASLAPQVALIARNHQLATRNRRTRQTLEGVIASSRMGLLVSDVNGRLSMANRAAADLLGIDLEPLAGQPMRTVVEERIKWRFVNPKEWGERVLAIHRDPTRDVTAEAETVDGRVVEHSSAPVHDVTGQLVGRVDIFHDVTAARSALLDARRLAAERAALLEREERRAQEEVALSRAAHLMASALTRADIFEHLLGQVEALIPAAEKTAVLFTDARGVLAPAATHGFSEVSVRRMTLRAGEGVVGRVMSERRPFICNDTEVDERVTSRILTAEGIRSFVHAPLVVGDRVRGIVSVNSGAPRAFGERELRLLTELTRHAASALQNALQFEQERHIAETLQQALIAEQLPSVPGLDLAALYQAAAGSLVGGDFYSAWPLPDGRLALLVGDVSGKGVEAAGVTAMVRYMAEALSQHRCDPGALVGELNDMLCPRMPDGALVTLVLAFIDISRDELRWSCAGHQPPVLVGWDGSYRTLDDPDPPCGIFPGQPYRDHCERFATGDLLFLYTDGLTEARREGVELGEAGLREAVREAESDDPETLARAVYGAARAWCGGRLTDDVAIAVVKRTA